VNRTTADLLHEVWLDPDAAVRDRGVRGGHLPPAYTAMPWPIGTLPIVEPDHLSSGSTCPGLSPGKSIAGL